MLTAVRQFQRAMPRCGTCGQQCDIGKIRIRSKNTFRCAGCSSKINTLRRKCGSWPTEQFAKLTDAQKRDFFAAAPREGKKLMAAYTSTMQTHEQHEQHYDESGQFLPLAAWEKKGFDPKLIEERSKPWNIMNHEILGKVYRVALLETGERGSKGQSTTDSTSTNMKRKASAMVAALRVDPAEADEPATEEDVDEVSSSSSTSSSSSSNDRKKKKKKKQNGKKQKKLKKKEAKKKEQERKAKEAEKALQKAELERQRAAKKDELKAAKLQQTLQKTELKKNAAMQKLGLTSLPKVSKAVQDLSALLGNPTVRKLPSVMVNGATTLQGEIVKIEDDCKSLAQGIQLASPSFTSSKDARLQVNINAFCCIAVVWRH